MTIKPWKIIESSYLRPYFRVDKCEVASGSIFEPFVLEFRPWANVLALTSDYRAVMVNQYRHGIARVMMELPGGIVDEGESPLDAVKRELLEETGYTADDFIEVSIFFPNPAIQSNKMHCFLARNAVSIAAQHLDDSEEIEVHLIPLADLVEMAKRGEFTHALQMAALFACLAHMNRAR